MRILNAALATAREKAVLPLLRSYVMAFVDLDGELLDGSSASRSGHGDRRSGMILSVELMGPGSGPRNAGRMISVKQQAGVWHSDEIVPAARRAAEKILEAHPSWRRLSERGPRKPADALEAAFAGRP